MPNFDAHGRDLGDATAIRVPDAVANLRVEIGDDAGKAEAIRKIREATGKPAKSSAPPPATPASEQSVSGAAPEDEGTAPAEPNEEPPVSTDAQPASKRSLKVDEIDDDLLIEFEFEGETLSLSKDDLKKGVGLYRANNKKAEEIARERKALEAERAALTAKVSNEVSAIDQELTKARERETQLDDWLEYAYRNNYVALNLPDGSKVAVDKLEKERKALEISMRRLQRQEQEKQQLLEENSKKYQDAQREILRERDPDILDRFDDIVSYAKRLGFDDASAQQLMQTDARIVLALDKARRFDNAISSRPEAKKTSQTKVISKSTASRSGAHVLTQGNSDIAKWQETVRTSEQGSSQYVDALRNLRKAQRAQIR